MNNKKPKIRLITTSKDKFNETNLYLSQHLDFEYELEKIDYIHLNEIQGTSIEIIKHKLIEASKLVDGPLIVEDSSFSVPCLDGLPGPYIKDFFCKLGNMRFYKMISAFKETNDLNAFDRSYLGFSYNDTESSDDFKIFEGETKGTIVEPNNTKEDEYNWCFFFVPEGETKPYGNLNTEEKNRVSARKKTLAQLCEYLCNNKGKFKGN